MASPEQLKYPGQTLEAHPEVFTSAPTFPDSPKPGQLTKDQFQQFFDKGYVLVENFFKPEELEPVKADIEKLVDDLAKRLYKYGKIKNLYSEYGLFQRLTKIDEEFPGASVLLHKVSSLPQAFRALWSNERLLNVGEQILGTADIVGHPIWNLRTKIPKCDAATVPWHQDSAYLHNESYDVLQLTAWIPLLDSNPQNGCMQVVEGGHRQGRMATHHGCWRDTWYLMLEEEEMKGTLGVDPDKDIVTCAVPYGGVLLFANTLPHRSLPNTSEDIRWSLDLRWQRADRPTGAFNVKHGLRMRSSTDPNHQINWHAFDSIDRHSHSTEDAEKDFDARIAAHYMQQWEITHPNRHTDFLQEALKSIEQHEFTVY